MQSESLIHELFSHDGVYVWCSAKKDDVISAAVGIRFPVYIFTIRGDKSVRIDMYYAPKLATLSADNATVLRDLKDNEVSCIIDSENKLLIRAKIGDRKTAPNASIKLSFNDNVVYEVVDLIRKAYPNINYKQLGGNGKHGFNNTLIEMQNAGVFESLFRISQSEPQGYVKHSYTNDNYMDDLHVYIVEKVAANSITIEKHEKGSYTEEKLLSSKEVRTFEPNMSLSEYFNYLE